MRKLDRHLRSVERNETVTVGMYLLHLNVRAQLSGGGGGGWGERGSRVEAGADWPQGIKGSFTSENIATATGQGKAFCAPGGGGMIQ